MREKVAKEKVLGVLFILLNTSVSLGPMFIGINAESTHPEAL